MKKINVTKTFLPPLVEYTNYIEEIWNNEQLTNQGPLLDRFQEKIKNYLQVDNFHFVTNGTIALQIALRALELTEGEIITTPFSYVATTSSILWERCKPVFIDIDIDTLCIDANKIEASITPDTKAIMAVHVFGNPCDVEQIEEIAKKHNLKVIYDGAHAFGAQYKGKSLLDYGDISICSFHATKLFHTIEGGGVFTQDSALNKKIDLIKRFGHNQDDHIMLGLNGKSSEFQAAMGLVNIEHIDEIIESRKKIVELYDSRLSGEYLRPQTAVGAVSNYSYYPIIFKSYEKLTKAFEKLEEANIFPRRYFYPSLNTLPYINDGQSCPISEDISSRIACLPLYAGLESEDVEMICEILNNL